MNRMIQSPPTVMTSLKPSAHSTIFVTGNRDLVFCHQRRKRMSSKFDIEDHRQRQKSFICVSRTQQVSSPATKIFILSDENRAVC